MTSFAKVLAIFVLASFAVGNAAAAEAPADEVLDLTSPPGESLPAGWTAPVPEALHAVTERDYPPASILLGEEGRVEVKYVVREDGSVGDVVVQRTSGYARLDQAAVALVGRWRFKPATHNGQPAAARIRVNIVWKLHTTEGFDTPGLPIVFVDPKPGDYPPGSRAAGESGITLLMMVVDERGSVSNVGILRSSGYARLDQAAMSLALGRWHPQPATLDGKPVKTVLMLAVRWNVPP